MRPLAPGLGPLLLASLALVPPAHPANYFVPSAATPTLQDAIDDAALNADPENTIYLRASPLFGNFEIGPEFDSDHRLTIRPDDALGLVRASVVAAAPAIPVFALLGVAGTDDGFVTLQDLDILRTSSGSASHLVSVHGESHVLIERCRVGLNWTTPGPPGYSNLHIEYPVEVVVRNCIFFSLFTGNFDHAIHVVSLPSPDSSVLLYNNLCADYRLAGIRIDDAAAPASALALLRNNVVANHPALAPEPFAFRSEVDQATIVTSHNTVFASLGFGESVAVGAGSIAGVGGGTLVGYPRVAYAPSFLSVTWTLAPPYDANPAFFRLVDGGPLHDAAMDYGQDVADGAPHARDVAVLVDMDRQGRPGGAPPHTDRGPDQLEPAVASSTPASAPASGALQAGPTGNPAQDARIRFASTRSGVLTFELFDAAGRRLAVGSRPVGAGDTGTWAPPHDATRSGVLLYRVTLEGSRGEREEVRGKLHVLR